MRDYDVIVIYYDGNYTKVKRVITALPNSTSPADFDLPDDHMITAVIHLTNSYYYGDVTMWIEGEQIDTVV